MKKLAQRFKQKGFSLIEMIGVLAIIAILLSAAAPNMIQLIKNERYDAEEITVDEVGEAVISYVVNRQIIPDTAGWADSLAPYIDLPPNDLTSTINGSRRYVVHPDFTIGNFPTVAFNQDSLASADDSILLSAQPTTEARILIISNLYEDVPNTDLTNIQFNDIWNQSGTIPTGFTVNDSVSIKRVSLNSLFYSLTFNISSAPATYSLNSTDVADELPWPLEVATKYVLKNTKVVTRDISSGNISGTYLANESLVIGAPPGYSSAGGGGTSSSGTSSSSAAGNDCSSLSNFNNGTDYAIGAEVYKNNSGTNYKYTSLQSANQGKDPESKPTYWNNDGVCL